MSFAQPLYLLLFIPFVFLLILWNRKKRRITFPWIQLLKTRNRSLRSKIAFLVPLFLVLSMCFFIVALARPSWGLLNQDKPKEGIAIEIVMDRSGSMGILVDENKNRLDVVKEVFSQFMLSRKNDLVGLITFARFAETLSPLTANYKTLSQFTSNIKLVTDRREDGTSLGDGLILAAARLRNLKVGDRIIKSKVVILLTDGKSNTGTYSPFEGAQKAAEWGIKVFTIGFGTEGYIIQDTVLGKRKVPVGPSVDEESLKKIAEITQGAYFRAENQEDLQKVLKKIDSLETSKLVTKEAPPRIERYYLFLWIGTAFFLFAWLLELLYLPRIDI